MSHRLLRTLVFSLLVATSTLCAFGQVAPDSPAPASVVRKAPPLTKAPALVDTWSSPYSYTFRLDNSNLLAAIGLLSGTTRGGLMLYDNGTAQISLISSNDSYLNTGHNFGIGTAAPATRLHVQTATSASDLSAGELIRLQSVAGSWSSLHFTDTARDAFIAYNPATSIATSYMGLALSNNNPQFVVSGQGNVGIGTVAPNNPLHIRASTTNTLTSVPDTWPGMVIERNLDGGVAGMVIQGGRKATVAGGGRIYLGNADEWDSTMIEGGGGKLTCYVRNAGAAMASAMTINNSGDLKVQGNIEAKYQDVAEWVPAGGTLASGTVVVLNRTERNAVTPSTNAYDTAVAGVVSSRPGVLLGEAGLDKAKIATTGRVKVRVDASRHAVAIGDLLVSSDKPGMAMVSEPIDIGGAKFHRPGTIVGKALEPLATGEGEILVLLSLQ
jgi:hypothetical protein